MKKLIYLTSVLFLTIFLIGCAQPKEVKRVAPTSVVKRVEGITLILDFGEGEISTFSGIKVVEKTVFSALKKVIDDKKLELKTKEYSFGNLVTQIGDKVNTKEKAWIYFVNGKSGEVAADKKEVKDGDIIEWKYMKPEF